MIRKTFPAAFLLLTFSLTNLFAAEDMNFLVWQVPKPDNVSIDGKADLAVLDAFQKTYPNLHPEASTGLRIEGPAAESGVLMSIAGGTAPAAIYVNFRTSGTYIEKGFIQPLDEYIDESMTGEEARAKGVFDENVIYRDELERRIIPQSREVIYRVGPDGKKHWWSMPYRNLVMVLIYNKALFQRAGIDPDTGYPKSWDDMWEISKKITDKDKGIYAFQASNSAVAGWFAFTFFSSMNVRAVKQNPETRQWEATFNQEGAAEAADFYVKMVQGAWTDKNDKEQFGVTYTDTDGSTKWNQGEIAMKFTYLEEQLLSKLSPEEYGIAPVPLSPTGTRGSELNCAMAGLFAGITDPKVKDAAWKYIRFFGGDEAQKIRTRVYVENGYGAYIAPDRLRRFGYGEYAKFFPKGWEETFKTAFECGVPEPYGKNCQMVYNYLSSPLEYAINNEIGMNPDKEKRLEIIQGYLDNAVADANDKMIGYVPPKEMSFRRIVAGIFAAVMFGVFVFMFIYIWKLFTPKEQEVSHRQSSLRKYWMAYLMLAPAILATLLFRYVPLFRGAVMAFQDYNVMYGFSGSTFVGLDNFATILWDPIFWVGMKAAAYYTVLYITMVFIPPILLAVLLSEVPVGKVFFRVVFYLPAIISGIIMMILWKKFLSPDDNGFANWVLSWVGIGSQKWLNDTSLAMFSIMIPQAWAGMGPGCLIYLAALKTVPEDLYESAAIDGAGFLRRVWFITIPMIRALIFIQLIFALIQAFQAANYVLIMTGGGPNDSTRVIGLEIFYNAYVYLRFGIATAMGWILGFMLIGFTAFQMTRLSKMTFKTAEGK
jgi:multiple sugar transport system permease protein